ncbi:hypothetical protein [Pacificoceanicola onchidii]|uniref:hypothetical protein n=1 Tax=Pacificoceanicola onchidii TaxID=2562685 RepID=UPI0010A65B69|nr:hypothetical protein [Pacificoceanicola onchidii]
MTYNFHMLGEALKTIFLKKAKFRTAFYTKLSELAPELDVFFAHSNVQQTEMVEKFMARLIQTAAGGQSIDAFAREFASSHSRFQFTPAQLAAAQDALLHAYDRAVEGTLVGTPEMHANWHMFVEFVFMEFRAALRQIDT